VQELREMGATISELPPFPNVSTSAIAVEGAAAMDYWVEAARAAGEDPGTRFGTNGRTETALAFLQAQRRRLIGMREWEKMAEPFDVMVGPANSGATNSTGHPAVVVQTSFGQNPNPQPAGGGGGGAAGAPGRAGAAGAAGGAAGGAPAAPAAPAAPPPDKPYTTTIYGKLFGDDMLLSVAHAYQVRHDFNLRKPPQFL
jgi:hypothetical protein